MCFMKSTLGIRLKIMWQLHLLLAKMQIQVDARESFLYEIFLTQLVLGIANIKVWCVVEVNE